MTKTSTFMANTTQYRVDGEAGRYSFDTHKVVDGNNVVHDTAHDCFNPLKNGRDHYHTVGFKELALLGGCVEESYRKTSDYINRFRCQPGATPFRTLCAVAECEGTKLREHMRELSIKVLEENGFDKECGVPPPEFKIEGTVEELPGQDVEAAARGLNISDEWRIAMRDNPVPYENPAVSINVSIDDVFVKGQRESRRESGDGERKAEKKKVRNTVVHVSHDGKSYIFNAVSTSEALKILLAFLIGNGLLNDSIIFYVDGERSLRNGIVDFFKWHKKITIILDWYHLRKKCSEILSMGLKGRKIRAIP
jgi:hypothetical protein